MKLNFKHRTLLLERFILKNKNGIFYCWIFGTSTSFWIKSINNQLRASFLFNWRISSWATVKYPALCALPNLSVNLSVVGSVAKCLRKKINANHYIANLSGLHGLLTRFFKYNFIKYENRVGLHGTLNFSRITEDFSQSVFCKERINILCTRNKMTVFWQKSSLRI